MGEFIGNGIFDGSRLCFRCGGHGCFSVVTMVLLSCEVVELSTRDVQDFSRFTIEALGTGWEDKESTAVAVVCWWVGRRAGRANAIFGRGG